MRILLVEDQKKVASFIKKGLVQAGYAVDVAESGAAAETLTSEHDYHLIILDVMLPDISGVDVAQHLRRDGYAGPILMLTALSETKDRIRGLDAGADDYLPKPFEFDELYARIRALLRRASPSTQSSNVVLRVSDLELNLVARSVTRGNQKIHLTPKEFALLEYLMRNTGRPVSRMSIAEGVWDMHYDSESNVVDVYVNTLRKKVDAPFDKKLIHTVIGVGYVLKEDESA